jgi:transcriptional regulator with XRE-family HTH domain
MAMRNTIKEFVEGLNITVYEFGKRSGISLDTAYSLYHNPERIPTGTVMGKICDTFKIQPNAILKWEESINISHKG